MQNEKVLLQTIALVVQPPTPEQASELALHELSTKIDQANKPHDSRGLTGGWRGAVIHEFDEFRSA
jgi:hypothetical protein